MIIKKFLHSCILLEKGGKRILIDPGSYTFIERKVTPKEIGQVDAILITHSHPDHYYPDALKAFVAMGPVRIIASEEICGLLEKEKLPFEIIKPGEVVEAAGCTVKAIEAPHGPLPIPVPHNMGYLIDGKIFDPGDCVTVDVKCEVLLLPALAPWERLNEAIDFTKRVKPKVVVPVHDWFVKDFSLERFYSIMCKPVLEKEGIEFKPLQLGEKLEV